MDRVELKIYYAEDNAAKQRCTVSRWKFYDSMMGEQYILFTLTSEKPVDWAVGDWCEFRGERYTLNYVPSVTQKARTGECGDAYTYENVKFESYQEELTRCLMLDITPTTGSYVAALGTNYTGSSKFTLFCGETMLDANGNITSDASLAVESLTAVCALAAKMQANLDRMYPENGWKIFVDTTHTYTSATGKLLLVTHTEDKVLTFDNTSVAQALSEVHNTFDLDYCIRGRMIYIGYNMANLTGTDDIVEQNREDNETFSFGYGKGYNTRDDMNHGLFKIKRVADSQQKIVTRLRALGSTKNLPYRYYNKKHGGENNPDLSQTLFPTNLQLPDTFESAATKAAHNALRDASLAHVKGDTNDSYIDKNNDAETCKEGIREDSVRFDGSNPDLPEIYPTIEEATYGELRSALVQDQDGETGAESFINYDNDERIDKLLAVGYKDGATLVDDANKDDGILPESGIASTGIVRYASIGITYLNYNTLNNGDFSYADGLYRGTEKTLFKIQGVAAGSYAMAPNFGAVKYGFSMICSNDACSCFVGFIMTVKARNVQTDVTTTIATYNSGFIGIFRGDGITEMDLPDLPDVTENSPQVSEIRVDALSDIIVTFTPVIKDVYVYYTDNFSISYQVGKSRIDNSITTGAEYTWFPVADSNTLTDIFHVFVQDMGFDFEACWSEETPMMVMKSGRCVGREFEIGSDIQKVTYGGKKGYMLTLKRDQDSSLNTYYPSQANPIAAGDHFVLLGIQMPEPYVKMAEVRLLRAATDYLADNCETKFTYQPSIDDIYLQRNLDKCRAEHREHESIWWRLYAGLKFTFLARFESGDEEKEDELLTSDITIEKVTISMGESLTPKVELTLNDDVQQGIIQKLTTSVDRIYNGSIFSGGSGNGAIGAVQASILSILQSEGEKRFLSKTKDDTASGKITFGGSVTHEELLKARKGIIVGHYQSGLLGNGALIDEDGNAEFNSIYSRNFISTPEFRFNKVDVTEGEDWCTNGFGTIQNIEIIDETTGYIELKLEENDYASIEVGDICRGIYNDYAHQYVTKTLDDDSELYDEEEEEAENESDESTTVGAETFGFSSKQGYFTSYFWIVDIGEQDVNCYNKRGKCRFKYQLRNTKTPHPCEFMKFAQYGSFTNESRRSSSYSTSIGHYYEMVLDGVSTWKIQSANVVYRKGYLGNMHVTIKVKNADGSYKRDANGDIVTKEANLQGYGLYVQDNVYFGNAVVQLDPETLKDVEEQLKSYTIDFSEYVNVITVDDVGNVIGGLYTVSGSGNQYREYRIQSAISVRRNDVPLVIAEDGADAGEGTYKIYVQPRGCTCMLENSTLFITSINNIKDGVVGSADDANFDYDAMREMSECSVDLIIDCEGKSSIQKSFPIRIKHESVPFVSADISNEFSGVSWNTQTQSYIGLPVSFDITMWHNDQFLDITSANNISLSPVTPGVTLVNGTATATPAATSIYYTKSIVTIIKNADTVNEYSYKVARIQITALGADVPLVTDINVTTSAVYAGVTYERTLVHTINKSTDTNVYSLLPSVNEIIYDKNNNTLSANGVSCQVICDSSDNKHYEVAYANLATHGIVMYYKKFYVDGTSDANDTPYTNTAVSISSSVREVRFYLYGLTNGSVDRTIVHDTEGVPVIEGGVDATTYWFESDVNSVPLDKDGNRKFNSFSVRLMKKKGEGDAELCSDFFLVVYRLRGSTYGLAQSLGKTNTVSVAVISDKSINQYIVCAFASLTSGAYGAETPVVELGIGVTVDGEPGENYYLTSDINTIVKDYAGNFKGSARPTITAWKKVGEDDSVRLADIVDENNVVAEGMKIKAYEVNSNGIRYTNESTTGVLTCIAPDASAYKFEVELVKNNKTYATFSIPIMQEVKGDPGADGIYPRDRGLFKNGESYYYVKSGDMYIRDKVNYEVDGIMYGFLVKEKGSTVTAAPNSDSVAGTDTNWEMSSIVETVIANTVFGTNANIGGFMMSADRMLSQRSAYILKYWGQMQNGSSYSLPTERDSDGVLIRWVVCDYYNNGNYYVSMYDGYPNDDEELEFTITGIRNCINGLWRPATAEEISKLFLSSMRIDGKRAVGIPYFRIDGAEHLIELFTERDTYWRTSGDGMEIGRINGRKAILSPDAEGLVLYDENGEVSSLVDSTAYSSIADLFSSLNGETTFDNGSVSYVHGGAVNGSVYSKFSGNDEYLTVTPNSVVEVTGTVVMTANEVNCYGYIAGSYWDSNRQNNYYTNHAGYTIMMELYSDTTCQNLVHRVYLGSGAINATKGSTSTETKTIDVSYKTLVNYTAGYSVVYAKVYLEWNFSCANLSSSVATVSWTGLKVEMVGGAHISRIFANGISYGTSLQNFFAVVQEGAGMHIKALTGNGNYGFEVTSSGVYVTIAGTRYLLTQDNGTAKLTAS